MVQILELNVLKATLSMSVLMAVNDSFTLKHYALSTVTLLVSVLVVIAHKNKSLYQ